MSGPSSAQDARGGGAAGARDRPKGNELVDEAGREIEHGDGAGGLGDGFARRDREAHVVEVGVWL